jgi:Zn-dependent oligopeptidase
MAKTKSNVLDFLSDLRGKLKPYAEKELKTLVDLKEKHCKENNLEFDSKINSWDFGFYNNLLLDTEY